MTNHIFSSVTEVEMHHFSFLHEAGMISGSRSQICTLENQVQNYVCQDEEVAVRQVS